MARVLKFDNPPSFIEAKSEKNCSLVKRASGFLSLNQSSNATTILGIIEVEPVWIIYKLIPKSIAKRAINLRLKKVIENFNEAASKIN